jgi:hypothetical protein
MVEHAAPGRQVSTWAHAVKDEEVIHVGGFVLSFYHPPPEFVGMPRLNPFFLCDCIFLPMHREGNPHEKVVHLVILPSST